MDAGNYTVELDVVRRAVKEAAAAVMEVHDAVGEGSTLGVVLKEDDRGPVTEADNRANAVLIDILSAAFPKDAILSEELADDAESRLVADRYWCIDPLDGTKEFIKRNGEFAVMVALVERKTGRPVVGAVAEPATGRVMFAVRGAGTWVEESGSPARRLTVSNRADGPQIRIIVSRSHPDVELKAIMETLTPESVTPCGSVGVKIGRISQDCADMYINFGGRTHLWDTCAPELLLEEAGGKFTELSGDPINYNRKETINSAILVASNGACHETVLSAARAVVSR